MIQFVEGPPGSGKTLYAMESIWEALAAGRHVYTNIQLVPGWSVMMALGGWRRWFSTDDMVLRRAQDLRARYHLISSVSELPCDSAREGSRLVVIDECHLFFNARDSLRGGGDAVRGWVTWFCQHRKFGCDVQLVTQDNKMVDRQIRLLAEQSVKCFPLTRWSVNILIGMIPVGWLLSRIFGPLLWRRCTFVGVPLRLWSHIGVVPRWLARMYDTTQVYQLTDLPSRGGGPGDASHGSQAEGSQAEGELVAGSRVRPLPAWVSPVSVESWLGWT